MAKLKQPRISKETDEFIEFEIPEGKKEEYDLPEGCFYYSNGQDFSSPPNFFEYWVKNKSGETKYKIGDEVWIIEEDLSISPKKIVGYKEVEGKITYELDVRFCQGISKNELSKTKTKAEVKKKNFLDELNFKVGDLVVFEYKDYSYQRFKKKTIGRIDKIEYSNTPYKVMGTYREFDNISDEDILLKIRNEFIEDYGNLQELYEQFKEKDKEIGDIINLINSEHDRLEKELETSIKKEYSFFHWNKSKPLFKDRFCYERDDYE